MMHPLAVALDEVGDKTSLAGQILNKLQRRATKMKILPEETAAGLFGRLFLVARMSREIICKKSHRAVDRIDRHREVIEPNPEFVSFSHL
jgi:hypothetical protein